MAFVGRDCVSLEIQLFFLRRSLFSELARFDQLKRDDAMMPHARNEEKSVHILRGMRARGKKTVKMYGKDVH